MSRPKLEPFSQPCPIPVPVFRVCSVWLSLFFSRNENGFQWTVSARNTALRDLDLTFGERESASCKTRGKPMLLRVSCGQVLFGCFKRKLRSDVKALRSADRWGQRKGQNPRWPSSWAMCRSKRRIITERCPWRGTRTCGGGEWRCTQQPHNPCFSVGDHRRHGAGFCWVQQHQPAPPSHSMYCLSSALISRPIEARSARTVWHTIAGRQGASQGFLLHGVVMQSMLKTQEQRTRLPHDTSTRVLTQVRYIL